jgi:predicted CoA-substrate-specific enzyme activase
LTSGKTSQEAAIGLDLGSTYCKGVAIDLKGKLLDWDYVPTGWNVLRAAETLAARLGLSDQIPLAATGYGRFQAEGASIVLTEISSHALGAELLCPGAGTVIDVGGQDTKAISVVGGKPREFLMNDKCAAGTGRFLEMALKRLDLTLKDLDDLPELAPKAKFTSVCAVFAESEMMGLLAEGRPRLEIAKGAVATLADKTAALAARIDPQDPVVLTGGLSESRILAEELGLAIGRQVRTLKMGFYAGALGAAWAALKNGK